MRRDFIANASHELRSPLTVISGYLDSLSGDDEVPEGWREPVAQMRKQAERMNRVVGELLELSRLENPGSAREAQAIDVAALIALAHMTRELFRFTDALTNLRLHDIAFGDGLWAHLASRVSFLRERSRKHKRRHRRLLREVRDSTNAMPDGGVVLNRSLEILIANRAARQLIGIRQRREQLV